MRQKTLRQMAKELGVSHAYLSQIKKGKMPASQKVVSKYCLKIDKMVDFSGVGR